MLNGEKEVFLILGISYNLWKFYWVQIKQINIWNDKKIYFMDSNLNIKDISKNKFMYFFGNANISHDNENIQLITKYKMFHAYQIFFSYNRPNSRNSPNDSN